MTKLVPIVFPQYSVHSVYPGGKERRVLKFRWQVMNTGDEDAKCSEPLPKDNALPEIIGVVFYDATGNVILEQNVKAVVSWDERGMPDAPRNHRDWFSTKAAGISRDCAAVGSAWQTQFDIGTRSELPDGDYDMEFCFDPLNQYGLASKRVFPVSVANRSVVPLEEKYF